jgi:hypothetical protein
MFLFPCLVPGFWWIFPIIMIAMMVLCFFMMRGCAGRMMCRPGTRSKDSNSDGAADLGQDIQSKK